MSPDSIDERPHFIQSRVESPTSAKELSRMVALRLQPYAKHNLIGVFLRKRGKTWLLEYHRALFLEFDLAIRDCRLIWVGTYPGGTNTNRNAIEEDLRVAMDAGADRRYG